MSSFRGWRDNGLAYTCDLHAWVSIEFPGLSVHLEPATAICSSIASWLQQYVLKVEGKGRSDKGQPLDFKRIETY